MTYEEALKIIGEFLPNEKLDNTQKLDALMKGMEALEKQISKKPTKNYECTVCHLDLLLDDTLHDGQKIDYCPLCGQAIDWSKE